MSNYTEFIRQAADRPERHADPIDHAADRSQQEVDHLVIEAQMRVAEQDAAAAKAMEEAGGKCLYCQEPVKVGRRWCDAEHRDAYELEQRVHARRGLR